MEPDMSRISTGAVGEALASEHLTSKKYKILGKNFRNKLGEIDIIARHPKGQLVFVEVKTLRVPPDMSASDERLFPEDHLTKFKLEKLQKLGEMYLMKNPEKKDRGWQIDLIAIELPTDTDEPLAIRHVEQLLKTES